MRTQSGVWVRWVLVRPHVARTTPPPPPPQPPTPLFVAMPFVLSFARHTHLLDRRAGVRGEGVVRHHIGFVGHHHHLFVGEEGSDGLEEFELLVNRVPALLGDVEEIEYAALQVRKRRDGLHFDRGWRSVSGL